jgi:MOSC domain-containing protein YiiM
VEGLGDDVVCIGDRYRIGSTLFEVTQPTFACSKKATCRRETRSSRWPQVRNR